MPDLVPGATIRTALELLDRAIATGSDLSGLSGVELLNGYRRWVNEHARLLEYVFLPSSLDQILLTPGYGRLIQLDGQAYGDGLGFLVALELAGATTALKEARDQLHRRQQEWSDWRRADRPVTAIVVDTNVLMRHGGRLPELKWWDAVQAFPNEPLTLGVPIVVVEELDRLKAVTGSMDVDGKEVPTKKLARDALKRLDDWFVGNHVEAQLQQRTPNDYEVGELRIRLMIDDLRHVRLESNDAEIIDRALALRPFTSEVALATNDRAMRFRARYEGLNAFDPQLRQPVEDE